jgi:hypothetical protein
VVVSLSIRSYGKLSTSSFTQKRIKNTKSDMLLNFFKWNNQKTRIDLSQHPLENRYWQLVNADDQPRDTELTRSTYLKIPTFSTGAIIIFLVWIKIICENFSDQKENRNWIIILPYELFVKTYCKISIRKSQYAETGTRGSVFRYNWNKFKIPYHTWSHFEYFWVSELNVTLIEYI